MIVNTYIYDGPVMWFEHCVNNNWHGETIARSEKEAKNNLAYQFKTKHKKLYGVRSVISLPGEIKIKRSPYENTESH